MTVRITRPEVRKRLPGVLAENRSATLALLKELEDSKEHGWWDYFYRFYHQSFKVVWLQKTTSRIVDHLKSMDPGLGLCPRFESIVAQGTGKEFTAEDNARWDEFAIPLLTAFFHAKTFLEFAAECSEGEDSDGCFISSSYAALLTLYRAR